MPRRLLLRLLASAPSATDHVPDAELLRRFATANDAAAFELVVRRHADAVWATCRQMLACDADAEDAFQATFLVLIRKAKAIRASCVGGWLHRVAVNAALKLRRRNARASTAEPQHLDAIPTLPAVVPDPERVTIVHEELARLPERERLPVVLCDLEGLSHAEAARVLGWPMGTVSGRLSRARAKLRDRLTRRGVTPSAAVLPALSVPPHLVPNALSLTAGAPPAVALLTEGVLSAMRTAKLKLAAAVLTATAFVALAGLGTVFALAPAADPPVAQRAGAEGDSPPEPDNKPKVDEKWQVRPFPSAFPDIPPLSTKFLDEFEKKHIEPIYESDHPLRKLQKARLRVSLERLRDWLGILEREVAEVRNDLPPPARSARDARLNQTLDVITKEARAAVALAGDAYPGYGARRPWLVLRVATEKLAEEANAKAIVRRADDADRLEAEIDLAKHDESK
jgi:RNA polymerase sigma factor (sigma-70 family)